MTFRSNLKARIGTSAPYHDLLHVILVLTGVLESAYGELKAHLPLPQQS